MNKKQAQYLVGCLNDKGVRFDTGLTNEEVLSIESRFLIRIPPDLRLFLQLNLPVSDGFVNWRLGVRSNIDADKIISLLNWPLEGMLFDLQADDFWIKSWGDMPKSCAEKQRIAKEKYPTLPKLIPIYSHRYIPSRPHEHGNPVFSVHQMDIIFYGHDLSTYLANEFNFNLTNDFEILERPNREIDFWSKWVDEWTEN
jgi:hypothetical protein